MVRKQPGPPEKVSPRLQENLDYLQEKLGIGINIDILRKDLNLAVKLRHALCRYSTNGGLQCCCCKTEHLTYAELCPIPAEVNDTKDPHMEMKEATACRS